MGTQMPDSEHDEHIVENVLRELYDADDTLHAIESVLAMLGAHYNVSRAYIFEDSADGMFTSNTFEWCAQGISPQKSNLQNIAYSFEKGRNTYYSNFDEKNIFQYPASQKLSESEQELIQTQNIHSMLQCAIMEGGRRCGFVGYDDCCGNQTWTDEQMRTLSSVSKLLGLFLIKQRQKEKAPFSEDFFSVLDNSTAFIMLLDIKTFALYYANRTLQKKIPGLQKGAFCYKQLFGRTSPCDRCPVKTLKRTGQSRFVELEWPNEKWILASASTLRSFKNGMVMVTATDITSQKQEEKKLEQTIEKLRDKNAENAIVIKQSGKYILRYDIEKKLAIHYSDSIAWFGLPRMMQDYPDSLFRAGIILPESILDAMQFYQDMQSGVHKSGSVELHVRKAGGTARWFAADYTLALSERKETSFCIITFSDNTEMHEKELAYEKLQKDLKDYITGNRNYQEVDLTDDIVEHRGGLFAKYPPETSGTLSLTDLVRYGCEHFAFVNDRPALFQFFNCSRLIAMFRNGCRKDTMEFRIVTGKGIKWYSVAADMVQYPTSDHVKVFFVFTDIDEQHKEQERLENLATHDSMTHLLNHDVSERHIRGLLVNAGPESISALFMIDVDNFKSVNDTYGHQKGDYVLKKFAGIVSSQFRSSDIVGRFGGDEFIVFVPYAVTEEYVQRKVDLLVKSLKFRIDDISVTGSVGAALVHGSQKTFRELYDEADKALYSAKHAGKSRGLVSDTGSTDSTR